MSSWGYIGHNEQRHQPFAGGFVNFDEDTVLFRTFTDPSEASYEDGGSNLHLALIDLQPETNLVKIKGKSEVFWNDVSF
jgi:hypothetical protein